jgi:hypothetical protein
MFRLKALIKLIITGIDWSSQYAAALSLGYALLTQPTISDAIKTKSSATIQL